MKLSIRDFQSLGTVEIEATGLTVVVGPSNRGKSALIRAVTAALFNRSGDDFIRTGRTQTSVTLVGLPTVAGAPMTVEWQKGHNLNRFTIDGAVFEKVGVTAPALLAQAGYRDVFIGDKERNRGEEIRPQIAGQFDPPFLLTKLGSFVNDVISVVSRLGVLLNANGRCGRDLKAKKTLLTQRQKDQKTADDQLAAYAPIADLALRVEALQAKLTEAKATRDLVLKVKTLVAGRAALKTLCDMAVPVATDVPFGLGQSYAGAQALQRQRVGLVHIAVLTLPDATKGPLDSLEAGSKQVAEGQRLVSTRPGLAAVAAMVVGDVTSWAGLAEKCVVQVQIRDSVKAALMDQTAATDALFRAVQTMNGTQDQQLEADSALGLALAEIQTCPVCARPMEQAVATV